MQIELVPDDLAIRPMLGPAVDTRAEALAAVQQLLDQAGPALAVTTAAWRDGAKDDTVYAGPFIWTIIEHDAGPAAQMAAALAWADDFAATIRTTGIDVQVMRPAR
jgi:hypothetical protein